MATAKQLAARKLFAQRAKAGTLRKNPAKKRKAVKAVKPVARPSQATGKKPTKRLVVRRKKTATAPKGLFANPIKTKAYRVEKAPFTGPDKWKLIASFVSPTDAKQYARAVAKNSGDWFIRVVS